MAHTHKFIINLNYSDKSTAKGLTKGSLDQKLK